MKNGSLQGNTNENQSSISSNAALQGAFARIEAGSDFSSINNQSSNWSDSLWSNSYSDDYYVDN